MDDIVDELRQRSQPVPVPLDLPSEDDLVQVEEQLYMPLPREYREFLLLVSDLVLGSLEPATAADPHAHNYLPELAATAWDQGLPRHFIPVCQHANGYYCIDPDGYVKNFHQGKLTEEEWESIWYWAEDVWLQNRR